MSNYPVKERPEIEYVEFEGGKIAKVSTLDVIRLERYIDYLEHQVRILKILNGNCKEKYSKDEMINFAKFVWYTKSLKDTDKGVIDYFKEWLKTGKDYCGVKSLSSQYPGSITIPTFKVKVILRTNQFICKTNEWFCTVLGSRRIVTERDVEWVCFSREEAVNSFNPDEVECAYVNGILIYAYLCY